jgi:hypothetical protein
LLPLAAIVPVLAPITEIVAGATSVNLLELITTSPALNVGVGVPVVVATVAPLLAVIVPSMLTGDDEVNVWLVTVKLPD